MWRVLLVFLISFHGLSQETTQPASEAENTQPASQAAPPNKEVVLYVADGQFKRHLFRVFVADAEVARAMNPSLTLRGRNPKNKKVSGTQSVKTWTPTYIIPNQKLLVDVSGEGSEDTSKQQLTGTLMLFDLDGVPMDFWQPMDRVLAILRLSWKITDWQAACSSVPIL